MRPPRIRPSDLTGIVTVFCAIAGMVALLFTEDWKFLVSGFLVAVGFLITTVVLEDRGL